MRPLPSLLLAVLAASAPGWALACSGGAAEEAEVEASSTSGADAAGASSDGAGATGGSGGADAPERIEKAGGVVVTIQKPGQGPVVGTGSEFSVHYRGTIAETGLQFDTSYGKAPLNVVLGESRLVLGFTRGLEGLRIGTKATIFVPSKLGYGARGLIPAIRPHEDLRFEVHVLPKDYVPRGRGNRRGR